MYLIANWKQNLINSDLDKWFDDYLNTSNNNSSNKGVNVLIAPSFVLIPEAYKKIQETGLQLSIASQNISEFDQGAHTGEVGAKQLKPFAKYSIIGHSERRSNGESNESVFKKATIALEHDITPIVCFSKIEELESLKNFGISMDKILMAYEPIESIGTGNAAPVDALREFYGKTGLEKMIYGGSVDKIKILPYLELDFINGFLVGGASLNPIEFKQMFDILDSRL